MVMDETAMRLLHATGEQLHGNHTREIGAFEEAEMGGISPCQREYDGAVRYAARQLLRAC